MTEWNLKKKVIQLFVILLAFTVLWIIGEYYFLSENHGNYNLVLNVSILKPNLAGRVLEYTSDTMNTSRELTNELQLKGCVTTFLNVFTNAESRLPSINITFDSVFTELKDIKHSTSNIFFVESRCATERMTKLYNNMYTFNLNARQCCSVESAARTNPDREIYILHTCPLKSDFLLHSARYVQKLLLGNFNVHIVRYNMTELFDGTPAEELWESKKIDNSRFPVEQSSDILRLTLLWRFGGMYCDLDVVTIRSLDLLHSNYVGLECDKFIGNAILNFEPFGYGHQILTKTLEQVNKHFNGTCWSANGPTLVTNMILQECNTTVILDLLYCPFFKVYHQDILYPLHWIDRRKVFDRQFGNEMVKSLKKTGFTIHMWNKYSHKYTVETGSSQPYNLLAEEFCPKVYSNIGKVF